MSGKGKLDHIIQEHLVDDGIIQSGAPYLFMINEKEMKVNGKKQNQKTYETYKSLIEEATGIEMKANTNFQFSGSGKKDYRSRRPERFETHYPGQGKFARRNRQAMA